MRGYSNQRDDENIARALGKEFKISPKHCVEICRAIRGMRVEKAKELLEDVIAGKRAIKVRRYDMMVSHKKGIGPGRYPAKACKAILNVIKSAEANAESPSKKMSGDLWILTAASHRGRTFPGYMPRAHGRSSQWDENTVNIEIVLEDRSE